MKKISNYMFVLIFLLGKSFFTTYAQKEEAAVSWFHKHPVSISFGNALVGMPFSKLKPEPFYSMFTVGTEFYYKQKEHSDFYQTANLCYYASKYSTSAVMLNSEIGYRYILNAGVFAEGNLGVGYSHIFRTNAIYKQKDNNEFQQVRDWGTPRFMADFSFSVGYSFAGKEIPLSIYIKYGNYIDILYAPDIPALPHNSFQLGARFLIK